MARDNNNDDNKNDQAKAQVRAFLDEIKRQHDIDDEKIKKILDLTQRNGKAYVTWAWIMSLLIGLVAFFAVRQLDMIESRLEAVEHRQMDVRERLRVIEEIFRRHAGIGQGPP